MIVNYTSHELVDPNTLHPHPDNPNSHPQGQIEALCEVIRANGWRSPIVVSRRSGYIIKGHGRLQAALKLGCSVPVDYQDYADENAEIRDLVADNKIAELSILSAKKIRELRDKYRKDATGWGDIKSTGLLTKQFSKLVDAKPKTAKFPILILETQEEFDTFESIKQELGIASDGAAFRKILFEFAIKAGLEKAKGVEND